MRETLGSASAWTATAARTTARRGRARQVGEPRRVWLVHLSVAISGVWAEREGEGTGSGEAGGRCRGREEQSRILRCYGEGGGMDEGERIMYCPDWPTTHSAAGGEREGEKWR